MGMYAVNISFECSDDDGYDLRGKVGQEMDAFIGYAGPGDSPPGVLVVRPDRTVICGHTGESYDPTESGHEDTTATPEVDGLGWVGVRIEGGKAVNVKVLGWDEDAACLFEGE